MVQKCNKFQPKHGKVTQNMHGASRNYRYVWDVSLTMSRGCARITKPPYTPPQGTCLFLNLLIRLRVADNKCMSSSDKCEYLKVDTSTTHIFLATLVPCIALSHPKSWRIVCQCIQTICMIRSVIISLLISFLKTATIPTYKAFP